MVKKLKFLTDDNLFGFTEISDSEYLSTLGTNCCGVVSIYNIRELQTQHCYDGGLYSVPSPKAHENSSGNSNAPTSSSK